MYCKKCNKKGKIFDKFCTKCGEKLEFKMPNIKITEKTKKTSLFVILILIILFSTYKIVSYVNSPGYIASKYFKSVINNNVSEIYSYLDEYESTFVNKNILNQKMKIYKEIDSYKITKINYSNNQALVEFTYQIDNSNYTAYVLLSKTKDMMFFNTYKVTSGNLIKDITFKTPKNAIITVDSIDISNYKIEGEYYDEYNIPYMVKGTYEIKTIINGIENIEKVSINDKTLYYINSVEINEELSNSLEIEALDKIELIYSNIINGFNFSDIENKFSVDTNILENSYKSIKRSMINYTLTGFDITDIMLKNAKYNDYGKLAVTFDIDYTINYKTVNEEIKTLSSYGYVTVVFDYLNSTYQFYNLENYIGLER